MISVQHLSRRFGSNLAVDDVSFELERGEVVYKQGAGAPPAGQDAPTESASGAGGDEPVDADFEVKT